MFASELKALMIDPTFPREVDLEALDFYLAYGYVPGERCLLKGVRKLAPGTLGVYDLARDHFHTCRYWDLPGAEPGSQADPEELTGELERLLEDAVRRRTVADVPVGVLLSGGLDSSLVTAMAARVSSFPLKTYTVSFPGHGAYDEAQHARLVASHFGAKHTELVAEPATIDLLPTLARQYDEPLADSSMIPTYLVSRLIRQDATVALGGDGGDELFGGYTLYSWVLRQRWVRDRVPGPVRDVVARLARRLPVGVRGRTYLLSLPMSQADAVARTGLYFDYDTRRALVPALRAIRSPSPELHRVACAAVGKTTIQQLTAADFRTYLPDDILVKVDRASMLASLEVRAPFLDHRIITFAFCHVPDRLRATLSERKILPRRLARRLLPQGLDLHRKQGFSIPMSSWLKGNWGPFFESVLMNIDSLFHAPSIHTLFLNQQRGLSNSQRLFALVMFELWRREYRIAC
jgi:asparagine synthase (glutamine-hydrolysing)